MPNMYYAGIFPPGVCPGNERLSSCIQAECRALNSGVCPGNERLSSCIQAECRALNCTQKDQPVLCIRMDPRFCKKGCVCERGYLRNEDGICVLEDKCEPAQSCISANEEFVPCMQGVCRAKDCSQKGQDVPCPDIPQENCDSGCICKEHFLRAANGSCIPKDQCEQLSCTGENEVYTDCKESCPPEVCFSIIAFYDCSTEEPCTKGCACKPGYLRRDFDSPCIPTCKCPQMVNEEHCKETA